MSVYTSKIDLPSPATALLDGKIVTPTTPVLTKRGERGTSPSTSSPMSDRPTQSIPRT